MCQEGIPGEIILYEDDAEIVDLMIDYLYRQDYEDEGSSLSTHAHVYAIAEKYEILSLKAWVIYKLTKALKHEWQLDAVDLTAALEIVWTSTPQEDRGLRDLFITWIGDSLRIFRKNMYIEARAPNREL